MTPSGAVTVTPISGTQDRNAFVEFPFRIYAGDRTWVPPLRIAVKELMDREKHPFYKNAEVEFFLARRDGEIVGRVAAIIDHNHDKAANEKAGFFGFFECIDDQAVANALLRTAKDWTAARGAKFLRGPMNPSTNYECGLLVQGFEKSPMVMMTYNPRYYATLIEGAGLKKVMDMYAYESTPGTVQIDRIRKVADRILQRTGVTMRPINVKDFDAEVQRVWEVYNAAWEKNWGFVPMTKEEFQAMGKEMKMILKPELVLIGEKAGKVVGFALALPDVNQALKPANGSLLPFGLFKILWHQRKISQGRVLALGVIEEYRSTGLPAAFYAELTKQAEKAGLTGLWEMSWILEVNEQMRHAAEMMGAQIGKTYRIYQTP
ncbi:MAG TPA: hypothetical protein VMT93_00730 [Gemmatimonadaceae bacterium]|nr:hypothetical protein [Gemmatimonadaceae bacterium]